MKYRFLAYFKVGPSNSKSSTVHIMAVGSRVYLELARNCAWSFLCQHPNTKFVLHIGASLEGKANRIFRSLIRTERLELRIIQSDYPAWQTMKLKLILDLSGTEDIFMDADLRWNGPLPKLQKPTAYLEEFDMNPLILSEDIYRILKTEQIYTMMNLSFFTFKGEKLNSSTITQAMEIQESIALIGEITGDPYKKSKARLSEQIALSYCLYNSGIEVDFLKNADARNDGAFVESCYFGATGLGF